MRRLSDAVLIVAIALSGCASAPEARAPRIAAADTADAAGFASMRALVPDIRMEIRYAGTHNFVGTRIEGYEAPECYLLRPVAQALARVERTLREAGRRLLIYDCYRPVRAVAHFMRWAGDARDQARKAEFYPELDKSRLVPQYIAERSGHSRGATVDLTLLRCDAGGSCMPMDMGTGFDYFGELAHTDSPNATPEQRGNRHALRAAMEREGFRNYPDEWWHYTLAPEPSPETAYDFPVR
ncbi:M15 family metallopeptidase [Luteimonas aquatica]|uniref:M15 family metallopeptidase n=1 Tax=Luteimonas aquatica TaxID=450364 RepID=UPI002412E363|nr:M15 family metallopeptidase [Luteimonas aquatica]